MDLPGLRLHPLKGDRKGFYAVNVSGNWRIVFRFEGDDAVTVMPPYPPKWRSVYRRPFGGSVESWLRQQMIYDLAEVMKQAGKLKVPRYEPA